MGLPGFAVRISQITKIHNKDVCTILIQLTTMMRFFSSRRTRYCCLQVLKLRDNRITCTEQYLRVGGHVINVTFP